jgi:hypothetical protein
MTGKKIRERSKMFEIASGAEAPSQFGSVYIKSIYTKIAIIPAIDIIA